MDIADFFFIKPTRDESINNEIRKDNFLHFYLMLPATSSADTVQIPETGFLSLLSAGGVVAISVKYIKRKE